MSGSTLETSHTEPSGLIGKTRLKPRLEFLHFKLRQRRPIDLKRLESPEFPIMRGSAGPLCVAERPDRDRKGVWHSNATWVMRHKPHLVPVRRPSMRPAVKPSRRPRPERVVWAPTPDSTSAPVPHRVFLSRRGD